MDSKATRKIFKTYAGNEKNTGSIEGQVALYTERIKEISDHLKVYKKDNSSRRGLLNLVGKRKRLLSYLVRNDIERYRTIIKQLGLRK